MRTPVVLMFLLLLLGPVSADEEKKEPRKPPPKPLTTEQAAEAVLKAVGAKDDKALKALAEKDNPDPWLVADELCYRGEHDAAEAFAKAAPRVDLEKLPAYVEAWRKREPDKAERELLAAMNAALAARKFRHALEVAGPEGPGPIRAVVGVRLAMARGMALNELAHMPESHVVFFAAAEAAERLGWLARATFAYHEAGGVAYGGSSFLTARVSWEHRLVLCKRRGKRPEAAGTLNNLGLVHERFGDYAKARSFYMRAHSVKEALGDKRGAATTLGNIGGVYTALGDYAKALLLHERALSAQEAMGDSVRAAATLNNIGSVHHALGDYVKALSFHERALSAVEALGDKARPWDKARAARTLGNIGFVLGTLGNYAKALSFHQRALAQKEALGDKAGAATTLGNIGLVYYRLGDYAKALSIYKRALAQQEALGDKAGAAYTLGNIGRVHHAMGSLKEAQRALDGSARAARRLRATPIRVTALKGLALLHLEAGDASRALSSAQTALEETETMLGGLDEELAATARAKQAELFAIGTLAAVREEDAPEALTFLESGRAGALLDTLGKREALRWKAESLPPDLKRQDQEAQAAQNVARHHYDRALKRGTLKERRRAAKALDDATDVVREVAGRIQRELKQQAGLFYPRAETIESIESALEKDQAFILYGLCLDEALALVLRQDGERVVSLGKVTDVEAACAALDARDPDVDPASALAALKALLVDPLKLGKDVKQVLVSPEGPLCYLPFGALFDQTTTMTPSGTTHVLLLDEEREAGKGILSLGNPDYAGISEGAKAIYYRGRTLSTLAATEPEAEAIGTTTLLGANASEAGLRKAVSKTKRWKAVHFACHGLIDVERPMLSSLALSSAGDDDGFLTALEVLRMQIPADLAVLSACETGKGKVVKGEGIVGLTRAFMFAGAPRVICSLWKVDDEATQALMVKFYELWNPKTGKGLGAAEALKQAQAFIRDHPDHPKWKHPYYWAAWVLWGLAD